MSTGLLPILGLLTAAVAGVALSRRLHLPPMLAYLAVGTALGPHGLDLMGNGHEVAQFAEFGVVFLMFSIGLEFSLRRLKSMRHLVFGFGALQMTLTALGTLLITLWGYGQGWRSGVVVGLAVGMSSTAIVARMLSERLELHSQAGRQTMGVLLFQDLAVVPCLILFPALAEPGEALARSLAWGMAQVLVVLSLMIWLGQRCIAQVYDRVAQTRSNELFVLTTLWLVVGLSFATGEAGLSLALGAFVGGMLISETAYRHQVEADIRPYRDVLLGLFFVSIGMLLDLRYVVENLHRLVLAVVLLVSAKASVVFLIALLFGTRPDTAVRTAAQLAQAGEFGLVLIELGKRLHLIGPDVFQITLTAMLLSMFLAPALIHQSSRLGQGLQKGDWAHKAQAIHAIAATSMALENHVIICGHGRTGRRIGDFLRQEAIPYLALEIDPHLVYASSSSGAVVFGSGDRLEVLQAAGVNRARALVVAHDDFEAALRTVSLARRLKSDLIILARGADETSVEKLKASGATEVIPEVVEGGLMLAAETLIQIGIPVEQALTQVKLVQTARYASRQEGKTRNGSPTTPA